MTELFNFYSLIPKSKENGGKMKGFKNHFIEPNSRILMIGSSGSGKTNALLNFIERSSGEFNKIITCSLSTTDEPLYNLLKSSKSRRRPATRAVRSHTIQGRARFITRPPRCRRGSGPVLSRRGARQWGGVGSVPVCMCVGPRAGLVLRCWATGPPPV